MNDTTKKPWFKPELIVLVRGKPEEAVLESCKYYNVSGVGNPDGGYGFCFSGSGCGACLVSTGS